MKYKSSTGLQQWFFGLSCVVAQLIPSGLQAQQSQQPQQGSTSVAPTAAVATTPERTPVVRDVLLEPDGRLQLRLLDASGHAQTGKVVKCLFGDRVIAVGKTNTAGQVTITSLRPGLHTIAAAGTITAYRLWDKTAAPPTAISTPAIVVDDAALLGQYGYGYGAPTMMAPGLLATGATIAAVVAVVAGKSSGRDSVLAPPASP